MRRLIALSLALFFCGAALVANALPQGVRAVIFAKRPTTAAVAPYVGPGDLNTYRFWSGLRAYSFAKLGNRAANVCNVADAACVDMVTDAVTGALVVTTVGGSSCSVVVCTVKILYDQTGNNLCSSGGAACDLSQATIANRPQLIVADSITGKPALKFTGSPQELRNVAPPTQNQPLTMSLVANDTNTAAQQTGYSLLSDFRIGYNNAGSNTVFCYAGAVLSATATDGAWHGIQAVFNNAGSPQGDCNVDGTAHTGSDGAGNWTGASINLGSKGASEYFTGSITQAGMVASALSGAQSTALSANNKAFWGYP